MPKKKPIKGKPKVNKELDGLEIRINEFGQIESNFDIKEINRFLNREVDDKKLRDRNDITDEGKYENTYKDSKYWSKYSDEEIEEMKKKELENRETEKDEFASDEEEEDELNLEEDEDLEDIELEDRLNEDEEEDDL